MQWLKENPFDDIMKHTWTCHYPINGKPCGFCQPCRLKIKESMDFFFSKEALKRGFVYNYLFKKYEKSLTRLDFYFAVWLRHKYNPEFLTMNVENKNFGNVQNYTAFFKSLFEPAYLEKVYSYEPYFIKLLNSDIVCREMSDRGQEWGLI